jgi:hypothetical protein
MAADCHRDFFGNVCADHVAYTSAAQIVEQAMDAC